MGIPGNDGERWGIPRASSDLQDNVGVTLGTAQVSPINMANAYATLANGGTRNEVHVVQKVVDKNGVTLYEAKDRSKATVDTDIAADVTYALQQVVEEGSGLRRWRLERPVAGKTGTATNDDGGVSSSWFVGFTPQLSTAVMYVRGKGRESLDEPRPDGADLWLPTSSDGRSGYFGGNYPAKTWTSIMQGVMEGMEIEEFPEPAYVDGDAPEDGHEYVPPPPPKPTKPTKSPTGGVPTETPDRDAHGDSDRDPDAPHADGDADDPAADGDADDPVADRPDGESDDAGRPVPAAAATSRLPTLSGPVEHAGDPRHRPGPTRSPPRCRR